MNNKTGFVLLAITCVALFYIGLGSYPLTGLDESLYSEVSRSMVATGDYLVPHYNGQPFYDKPPIVYWLQAVGLQVFGTGSFAVRLPSVLMAFLLVGYVVWLTGRFFSIKAGLYAGFSLACCLLTTGLARMAIIDMTFTLFLTLALGTFALAYCNKISKTGYLLSWVFLGLSVMTKGPAGAVLVGAPIFVFLAIRKDLRQLVNVYHLYGLLLSILIALPWYLLTNSATNGDFLQEFVFHQNLARAMGKDFQHNGQPFYYLPVFIAGFLPWSIFLPSAIKSWAKNYSWTDRTVLQFMTVWFVTVFVIFSIIVSKLPGYIYPIYPAAAILVGVWWERADIRSVKWPLIVASFFLVLFAAAVVVMGSKWEYADTVLKNTFVAMAVALIAGVISAVVSMIKGSKAGVFSSLAAGFGVFLCLTVLLGLPAYTQKKDGMAVPVSEFINTKYPQVNTIIAFDYNQKQANMPNLPFYLGKTVDFIWDPAILRDKINEPGDSVVIADPVAPPASFEGLENVQRFGKYELYVEKASGR